MKLIHQIALAFIILSLALGVAAGVGFHYLKWVHFYQRQAENKWQQYQEMVFTEDILDELSDNINSWKAGAISMEGLKSKAAALEDKLPIWESQLSKDDENFSKIKHEKSELKLLQSVEQRLKDLLHSIASIPPKALVTLSPLWVKSLDQLNQDELYLRKFYFESLRIALAHAHKLGDRAIQNSIYFILIVGFLVVSICTYNIRVLYLQTKQLMEQERQMASAALVQNLAHEIRNPLGVIKSAASVIAGRVKGDMGELALDISTEVMRVDSLLTDLLRLRHYRDEPKIPTDIGAMVHKTAEFFAPKLQAANLTLQVYNTAPSILCPCRPDAIKQVLMNLILNAIEASKSKTVIEVTTAIDRQEYLLQVRDFGHGITNKDKNKMFDLFYTTKPYGFGIGLTVVKRVVLDHHGRIEVTRMQPQGTAFTVYLPMR